MFRLFLLFFSFGNILVNQLGIVLRVARLLSELFIGYFWSLGTAFFSIALVMIFWFRRATNCTMGFVVVVDILAAKTTPGIFLVEL